MPGALSQLVPKKQRQRVPRLSKYHILSLSPLKYVRMVKSEFILPILTYIFAIVIEAEAWQFAFDVTWTTSCRRKRLSARISSCRVPFPQWFRTAKHSDISTGALVCLFAHSLALLNHSQARGKVNDSCWDMRLF